MGTFLAVTAFVAAFVALGLCWKLQRELDTARRRLDRYNKALFDAGDRILALEDRLTATAAELRVQHLRHAGTEAFLPDMTVREVTLLHPQAPQVLAAFHLGGCSSCAVDEDDTLAKICAENGIDANLLLRNLNQLLTAGVNGQAHTPVKVPNVAVEF